MKAITHVVILSHKGHSASVFRYRVAGVGVA